MKPKFIQKNIRFPSTVIEVLEKDGERFGFNFNEYVKYLVVKRAEEITERMQLSKKANKLSKSQLT